MGKEEIKDHILEQMDEPTEVTADDIMDPICTWCGEELGGEISVWDIREHGNNNVVYRYQYCSDGCKDSDKMAVIDGETMHPHGESVVLTGEW